MHGSQPELTCFLALQNTFKISAISLLVLLYYSVHAQKFTFTRFFLTLLKHKSSINMSCGKTSPLETGEMPMAALRDQLHLASFLFLMCSAYKTMSHHTNPDAFYTLSSVFLSSGLGLYIPPSVSDFTPKSPASVLNGQVGVPLIFSYCFLLTQRGTERKQTEASDTVLKVLSVTVTLYFAIVLWCSDINA